MPFATSCFDQEKLYPGCPFGVGSFMSKILPIIAPLEPLHLQGEHVFLTRGNLYFTGFRIFLLESTLRYPWVTFPANSVLLMSICSGMFYTSLIVWCLCGQ
jgi:hypothetical protein